MKYQGLCNKYGCVNMMMAGYMGPPIALAAITAAECGTGQLFQACMAGAVGVWSAVNSHMIANKVLRKKQIGMKRGARIVRKTQAATYTFIASISLAFTAAAAPPATADIDIFANEHASSQTFENQSYTSGKGAIFPGNKSGP